MTKIGKRRSYEQLFDRLDAAMRARFFLESCWIAYAILEDRADSALEKTGGPLRKSRPMLGDKLAELDRRVASDPLLAAETRSAAILKAATDWKNKRNPLMHSMANEDEPWSELELKAESLAQEGRSAARALASAVMRLRKKRLKGR